MKYILKQKLVYLSKTELLLDLTHIDINEPSLVFVKPINQQIHKKTPMQKHLCPDCSKWFMRTVTGLIKEHKLKNDNIRISCTGSGKMPAASKSC